MPALPLYSALGCAVTLDVKSRPPSEIEVIARLWAGAVVRDDDPLPARHITVPVPEGDIDRAVALLSQAVTLAAIDARRGDLWMLHAGAVADAEGRVVAVVGPSGRGKTTATRALAAHYAYVTDETVGVASDGTVLPYRKPLSVVVDPMLDKTQSSPRDLGLGELPDRPLHLAAVVMLDRDPAMGREAAQVRLVDVGDALPDLVEQTSHLAELPTPVRSILAHVRSVGGVHRVTYGDASALPEAFAPLFQDPEPPTVEAAPRRALPAAERGTSRWYRGAYLDAANLDDGADLRRLALLQPDAQGHATLRVLDGVGPTLWAEASGAGRDELRDAAVARHGSPPGADSDQVIDMLLDALRAEGVLADGPAWRIRPDVAWTGEAGAYVALALSVPGSPQPISLEGTAGLIWHVVARSRGATLDALTDAIGDGVGAAPEAVAADVREFLESLREHALVELFAP